MPTWMASWSKVLMDLSPMGKRVPEGTGRARSPFQELRLLPVLQTPISIYHTPESMKFLTLFSFSFLFLALPVPGAVRAGKVAFGHSNQPYESVTWICSTRENPWQEMPTYRLASISPNEVPQVRVSPGTTYQVMDGFGGCFNEVGWAALLKASDSDREAAIRALFGNDGCAFNLARLPIGASDFGLDWYSLADTPGDTKLKDFSIERDMETLIPFVKAAMEVQPGLNCWGSPWSPPAWMKTNDSYSRGSLRWETEILQSYANYFVRWAEAYQEQDINIYAVSPQNEPNILNVYPTTLWTAAQLREFIADYLGPAMRKRYPNIEIWLGLNGDPFNGGENINDRLITVLEDPVANSYITGVAYQYDSRNQTAVASQLYPDKKFMQSETECNSGDNTWADAQKLYGLMRRYIEGGAGSYFAWNMVLDETGNSTWGWRQNALITVDHSSGEVTCNGEYYVMRHFSHFVKPGARRVQSTGVWDEQIAFLNPDGSTVMVIANSTDEPTEITLSIEGRLDEEAFRAELPPQSVNTFSVRPW